MSHRLLSPLAAVCTVLALLADALPSAATVPGDLCSGNPCVIARAVTVDAGSDLDFGDDDLVLAPAAALTLGSGANRSLTLRAGRITLQPGGTIVAGGADITLRTKAGAISVLRSGASVARIDVSANSAGTITLDAGGDVTVSGNLEARGTGRDAQAGSIDVTSGRVLDVPGSVLASGAWVSA